MSYVVNHCRHCEHTFRSFLSINLPLGVQYSGIGNIEQCPRCRELTPAPDVFSYEAYGRNRLIPLGASATPTPNNYLKNSVKSAYFGIARQGENSLTWKAWKHNDDVYVSCREVPHWKLSIHSTGQDIIGFTREALEKGITPISKGESRRFFTAERETPYAAHVSRICRITVRSKSNFTRTIRQKPGKGLARKMIRVFPYEEYETSFDIFFSEGHPGLFDETSSYSQESICLLEGSRNHYIIITPCSNHPYLDFNDDYGALNFLVEENAEAFSFRFGKTNKNTFLVEVQHV